MNKTLQTRTAGFTLIEVLLASVMFALMIAGVISARNTSLKRVAESRLLSQAQTLSEMKMTEMEIKYQGIIDKGGVKSAFGEEAGTFPSPYQDFKWKVEAKENPMIVGADKLVAFLKAYGMSDEDSQSQFEQSKLLLANLNKALKENMIELVVKVTWTEREKDKDFLLVTHLIPKKPKITFSQNTDIDKDINP